jgi:sulfite exporter TauE/SafE
MLASITPLGERGRHATWGITVIAFVLGATVAAAAAGALAGAVGALALPALGTRGRLAALAVAVLAALALDAGPARIPGPRRQVDERWLDEYRGWVYGFGFGAQLGLGFTTIVSSAATYVALIAALLTGDPVLGALVFGCFGVVRGLSLLAAAHVRRPEQLVALHASLLRWRLPVARAGMAVMGATLAVAIIGSLA